MKIFYWNSLTHKSRFSWRICLKNHQEIFRATKTQKEPPSRQDYRVSWLQISFNRESQRFSQIQKIINIEFHVWKNFCTLWHYVVTSATSKMVIRINTSIFLQWARNHTLDGARSTFGDFAAWSHFEVVRDNDGRRKTFCTLLSKCDGMAIALPLAENISFSIPEFAINLEKIFCIKSYQLRWAFLTYFLPCTSAKETPSHTEWCDRQRPKVEWKSVVESVIVNNND